MPVALQTSLIGYYVYDDSLSAPCVSLNSRRPAGRISMKKAAYGLSGLIVLLVAAALIVPSVIDWNGYKPEISAEVRKVTGRTLEITGDLEFTVLPAPRLRISGARLSNAPGATAAHMMSLQELRVSVALLPLLRGDIEIGQVDLIEPVIELEKLPNGQMNWLLVSEADGSAGSAVA
ncbi:MAG: AsmA family protein, partial [Alphaproteobacteria bacterium]